MVVAGSLVSGLGAGTLAWYLRRHRGKAGSNWFVAALLTQSLWCLTYGVGLLVTDIAARRLLEQLSWLGTFWTGPLFLAFALEYTGRGDAVRGWRLGSLFAIPAVTTVLTLTTTFHDLVWSGFSVTPSLGLAVAAYTIEPWGFFAVVAGTFCAGVGVLLLIETVLNYGPLYRREGTAVALSVVAPSAGLLLWLFRVGPVPYLNLAPALFVVHVALDGFAFTRSNMFETNPTTRRAAERSVIDDIGSPVFVLDSQHRIVELNDDAAAIIDLDDASTAALDAADVLGTRLETYLDLVVDPAGGQQTVTTRADGHVREYTAVVSSLTDPAGTPVGSTVVMQDVTDRRQREQRLSVLNRVIRHNLRNDMNAIMGRAELIEAKATADAVVESAGIVHDRATELHTISERAHEFERITAAETEDQRVDVGALVAEVVTDLREQFPEADVDTNVAAGVTVQTDPDVLALALSNLVSYLLEHNDESTPHVSVTASVEDSGSSAVLTVTDNGSGIERSELTPVALGRETDLEHATGIALWIVSWSVTALGGEIEFSETTDGTAVSIRLSSDQPIDGE